MKKKLVTALILGAIVCALAIPTFVSAGKLTTTISLANNTASVLSGDGTTGQASFNVTRSTAWDKDVFWVTNKCWDDSGALVERTDLAVAWGRATSLNGTAGPFETSGTYCEAYVTLKPWTDRPLGDSLVGYRP